MSRDRKVTVRFSEEEMETMRIRMDAESAAGRGKDAGVDAAGGGVLPKTERISGFIRKRCLRVDPSEELRKIRLILGKIESELRHLERYEERQEKHGPNGFADSSFTACRKEFSAMKQMIEECWDGGNGSETH